MWNSSGFIHVKQVLATRICSRIPRFELDVLGPWEGELHQQNVLISEVNCGLEKDLWNNGILIAWMSFDSFSFAEVAWHQTDVWQLLCTEKKTLS